MINVWNECHACYDIFWFLLLPHGPRIWLAAPLHQWVATAKRVPDIGCKLKLKALSVHKLTQNPIQSFKSKLDWLELFVRKIWNMLFWVKSSFQCGMNNHVHSLFVVYSCVFLNYFTSFDIWYMTWNNSYNPKKYLPGISVFHNIFIGNLQGFPLYLTPTFTLRATLVTGLALIRLPEAKSHCQAEGPLVMSTNKGMTTGQVFDISWPWKNGGVVQVYHIPKHIILS